MDRNEFNDNIHQTYVDAHEILIVKNSDYANSDNPFKNFEFADLVGIGINKAILVRVSDKIARISNLIDKDENGDKVAVKDETITDTIVDAINYLAILKAHWDATHKKGKSKNRSNNS